jgi:hypothetical protein
MSILKFTCFYISLLGINYSLNAQSRDTLSAQQVIERGSKGDVILGEKIKKAQLNDTAVLLHSKNTVRSKDAIRSSKKLARKRSRKS